jgi:hypothetical protein
MSIEKLYSTLVNQDLLSIGFDEFQNKLQDNNYKSKVYGAIIDQDLYSGNFDTFNKQFFDDKKINYNDADLGDKLIDLGARTAYGFVSFAEGLSDYKDGLLYTLSTIGEDGERTPEAKEAAMIAIKEVYGGDPFEKLMESLDKKTLEFDEKTITETFKEGDFAEGGFRTVGAGLQSLPSILAAGLGPAGIIALGASTAGTKYEEEFEEDPTQNAVNLLFSATGSGTIEAGFELATRGLLKRAGLLGGNALASGAQIKLAKEILRGGAKEIVKNVGAGMTSEAASEAATELTSTMWDQVSLGKKINWSDKIYEIADAGIVGGLVGGVISTTGEVNKKTRASQEMAYNILRHDAVKEEHGKLTEEFNDLMKDVDLAESEGVKQSLQDEAQAVLYKIRSLEERSRQGLRNLNKEELDTYFKGVQESRNLRKIIDNDQTSDTSKDIAQKKYDRIREDNYRLLEEASDRKLEQNLSEAENKARQRGGEIRTYQTQDEYIEAVSGVSAKKVLNKETGKMEYTKEFVDAARQHRYSDGRHVDGVSYINLETARTLGSVAVGSHEVFHSILDAYVKDENGQVKDEMIEAIDDMLAGMSNKDRKVLEDRVDQYKTKNGKAVDPKDYYDEYLTALNDAIVKKQITFSRTFEAASGAFNSIFRREGYANIDMSTGKGLFNMVRTYTKTIESGKSVEAIDKLVKESVGKTKGARESRSLVNLDSADFDPDMDISERIDSYTAGAKKQEDLFVRDPETGLSPFDNIYSGILEGKFDRVFGKGITKDQREIQRQNLADRFGGMTEEGGYDPAKTPELSKWMFGGSGIAGNIEFTRRKAKEELAIDAEKRKREKRIDAKKPTKEGETGFDVADTGALTPEEALIRKEEQAKELEKKQTTFAASLGLGVDLQNKIKAAVIKTFGTKLPAVTDAKYRNALSKAFRNEIGKSIEEIFGIDKTYDEFIDKYFKGIVFPNLSNARLIQIERLLPKDEKIFVDKRRITKVKEVRELQEKGLIAKTVKPASGPNLIQKKKLDMKKVKEFFNPPAINPKTGKKSGLRGTRKRALAEALAEELAQNQTDAVLQSPDVMNKVKELNTLFEYDDVNNYAAEVARQMDRGARNSESLNRAAEGLGLGDADVRNVITMDAIEMENEYLDIYNALREDSAEKYEGRQGFIDNDGFNKRVKESIKDPELQKLLKEKAYQLRTTKDGVKTYNEQGAKDHVNNYSIPLLGFIPAWMGQRDFRMQDAKRSKHMFLHRAAKMDSSRGAFGGDLQLRKQNTGRWGVALASKMGLNKNMSKQTKKLWADFRKVEGDLVLMESTMTEPGSVLRRVKEVQAMSITAKEKAAILRKEFNPKSLLAAQLLFKAYNSSKQDWFNSMTKGKNPKMTKAEAGLYIYRDKQMNTNFNKGERALAALTSVYLIDGAQKVTKEKGEHVKDSASVSAATFVSIYNGTFLQDADTILKGFEQSLLPKEIADRLDDLGGRNSQLGNYRFLMDPNIGKNVYDLATGKTMYQLGIEQHGKDLAKSMEKINDTSRASENLGKFYKAESLQLDPKTKPKGISVFDFDETAGISDNVIVATKNGVTEIIESADWPLVGDAMVKDGWEMDFSDFNKVTNGRPGPLMQKLKNQIKKYGNKDVFILTARASKSQQAIHEYLKSEGVDLPLENITGLGNSTGEAKADWMVDKLAEGYNDFYFVDDAMPNVKAVDDLLSQFDVKSKVVQAKARNSESLGRQVNEMLEVNEGVGADVVVDEAEAKTRGAKRGKGIGAQFFNTPGSNDFMGLMYTIANAKGKLGERQIAFFEENLYKPYRRGIDRINRLKQGISNNYKTLLKSIPNAADKLKEIVPGTSFTYDTAVRVYLFNQAGHEIPGLSDQNKNKLIEAVKADQSLIDLASGVAGIVNSPDLYIKPDNNWLGDTILSDLDNITNDVGRKQHIQEFIENRKLIFGEFKNGKLTGPMMNKLEALYGPAYVEALNDMIWRMENGNARPSGSNAQVNSWMNWISKSVGAIMFFNTRSALLQTLSTVNFINWGDNNPIKAAAAFANQKQFWKDFSTIFNSDFLKQRRGGLKLDVNEAALAKAVNQGGKNKVKAAIDYLLRIGFLPTQMADSFAIAAGGATFYRNRIKTYLDQGISKTEAESKAFQDMIDSSEPVQQSSDPSLISKEQASILGRMVLAFQNVTMQYTRRMKKSVIDLAKGRGDFKTNVSRIVYYGAVQNLVFNALQSALFALAFDDEEDKKVLAKRDRVINGMADSILRGLGIPGAVFSTGKNAIIEWAKQNKKGFTGDQTYTLIQLLNISPPIGSKARKFYSSTQTEKYNKKIIPEMSMWDISNPRYQSIGNAVEAITNVPMGRTVNKMNNIKQALDSDHQTWQRIAMMLGWNRWDVGVKDSDVLKIKEEVKKNQKTNQKSSGYKKGPMRGRNW